MSAVIVDSSVWRRWFAGRAEVRRLGDLLDQPTTVTVHPWVLGELLLGGLSVREQRLLERLPRALLVADAEVLEFIHHRRLARKGVGWVDAQLLASALASAAVVWTLDSSLAGAAAHLGVALPA